MLVLAISQAKLLDCDLQLCPPSEVLSKQRGDDYCDLSCNTAPCGFDSGATDSSSFSESDCYAACSQAMCIGDLPYPIRCVTLANFGNGACIERAATNACGWDVGICGFCAYHCELYSGYEADLGNQVCQPQCDKKECAYDGGDCVGSI